MKTERIVLAIIFATVSTCLHAQNPVQKGVVRTALRPDREIVYLSDVSIRQKGGHNSVLSSSDGTFEMVLPDTRVGGAFYLSYVRKAGYELADNATIGKAFTYSPEVPIEIVMLDSRAKQEDIIRITNNAYARAEKEYAKKVASLEQQLQDKTLSEENYRQQLLELQTGFEKYESLISDMAERYASTDYATVDSLNAAINIAIENADLERADSLISTVGSLDRLVRESQEAMANALERQKIGTEIIEQASKDITDIEDNNKRLGDLLYSKYSIALTRFETDSAAHYITLRAELDTTNAKWQNEAGTFISIYVADYDKATRLFRRALEAAMESYGENHPDVAASLNNIGMIYSDQGDYGSALEYLNEALKIKTDLFGESHPDVAISLYNIGTILSDVGDYVTALEYLSKALKIQTDLLEENLPDVAASLNSIGRISSYVGDYGFALECFNDALNIQTALFGECHPDVATSLNNIGNIYSDQGDYESALEHLNEALKIQTTLFGKCHPDLATSLNNIGTNYLYKGDYESALRYLNDALNIQTTLFGECHPDVATSLNNVGSILSDVGDYDTALEYLNKALKIQTTLFGENHPDVAASLNNIGIIYSYQGDYGSALDYLNEALEIRIDLFGQSHPDVATSLNNIAMVHSDQGDYDKALPYYGKALKIRTKLYGKNDHSAISTYNNIYDCYTEGLKSSKSYITQYEDFISEIAFTVTVTSEDTPAADQGMSGEYYLLEFGNWSQNSFDSLYEKNTELKGKPKDILVMKDGIISEHHFEDTIGVAIGLKYVGKEEKAAISKAYEKWKRQHRHESGK